MIRKILSLFLFLFCTLSFGQAIQMTTTSMTDRWSPFNIVKSGSNLTWTATNSLIGTITINENQPIFDFSVNDGSDIIITITSADGFNGLTVFDLRDRFNGVSVNGISSKILVKDINLSATTKLVELSTQYNRLKNLDISSNVLLETLNVRGSSQLSDGIDLSNNPLLNSFRADVTALSSLDFSNNPLIKYVSVFDAKLSSEAMDKIVIDLDNHGLTSGILELRNQTTGDLLTAASYSAYNNLLAKGWTIDVPTPPNPSLKLITITTTSKNTAWSPTAVVNSTATLKWAVTGGIVLPEVVIDDPVLNLGSNTGTGIITISSNEGFAGLTALDFWVAPGGGEIGSIDLSNALALKSLNMRYNRLSELNVTPNIALETLILRGNRQLNNQALSTSNNPKLTYLQIDGTGINSVNLTNNVLLKDVRLQNARLTSAVLDQVLIDLDNHGLSNGNLLISNQATGQSITSASFTAYNNLKAKGWTIDVAAPLADTVIPVVGILNNPTNITENAMTLSWSAGTDNVAVTNYKIYKNGVFEAQVGNLLTYEVTGLAPNTNYNFHITALDAAGQESVNSNTVQATTLQSIDTEVPVVGILSNPTNITQNSMTLGWSAGTDNVAVTNYKIYKNGVFEAQVGNLLTYEVTGLAPNTNYNFHITALDAAGLESVNSNTVQATTLQSIDTEVPVVGILSNPTNITQNSMTLGWSAGTDNVAVTNYKIYKNGVFEAQVGNLLTYEVTGLAPNTNYNFHITALDAAGLESVKSNTVQATTVQVPTGDAITITTTSSNAAWSPQTVTKTGGILTWTATGTGLAGSPIVINANDPTFNFSSNNGSPITIKVTSPDGFVGLTALDFWVAPSGGIISSVDVTSAAALTLLNTRYNPLASLDVSSNRAMATLILRGNRQLNNQALNTSNNSKLTYLQIDGTGINSVDLANNVLLKDVRLYDARLTSMILDKVLIDLDNHGLSNGNLRIAGQTTGQSITSASFTAYNNLKAKGWTIDVAAPLADTVIPVVGILNNPTNITENAMTLSWSAGTDNVAVTNYKIYKNGVFEAQVGNVLTYEVTGLAPNTNYNFHFTALDAAGLESVNSNTVQATTLQGIDTEVPVVGILSNPTNITQNSMTLGWSAGTDNVAVTNYKIYKNGVFEAQVGNLLTYEVTGLAPNTNYNFHITALDAAGLESVNSNTVQATTLQSIDTEVPVVGILSNPTNITQNSMTLGWSAGTDNVAVTNYKIYKNGVFEAQVGNLLTYEVTGLAPNTNYNFHITALDAAGLESVNSNTVQATTVQVPTGDAITITTTSSNAAWSPQTVTKTGGILTWTATGTGLAGSPIVINANDPTFNFSSNNGSPITIKVTSPDGFVGLTALDFWVAPSGGEISSIDLSNALALKSLNLRYNRLSELNVSSNIALETLILRGNRQLNYQSLNTNNNMKLSYIQIDVTGINSVDFSNNMLLKDVRLYDARLTSVILDKVLMDLDNHSISNGTLRIAGQTTRQSITSASNSAYNSLIAKGWTIDVAVPLAPIAEKGLGISYNLEEITKESTFSVFNINEGFNISSDLKMKEVKVYDMLGRIIISRNPYHLNLFLEGNFIKTGSLLIFQVEFENGSILHKRAIKL